MFCVLDAGNAPKLRGRGRPRGSTAQKKTSESAVGNLDSLISNIVGEVLGRLEQEAGKLIILVFILFSFFTCIFYLSAFC